MKALSSTELKPLQFKKESPSQKVRASTAKIGWIHSMSDKPGAKFDIVIKDALGRRKFERKNCGAETKQFGQLINLPTLLGEELEVSLENIHGAERIDLFLN